MSWSADARCNHRKVCFIAAQEKCKDPSTHGDTVNLLLRLWTEPITIASPTKRSRSGSDTQPLSPIISGHNVDYHGNKNADSRSLHVLLAESDIFDRDYDSEFPGLGNNSPIAWPCN